MPRPVVGEAITELRYALTEADTENPRPGLRNQVVGEALRRRGAGRPINAADHIDGVEAFRRMTARMKQLLGSLSPNDWGRPASRGLSVQQLVGHLIAVESGFAASVAGDASFSDVDHIGSTQPTAIRQATLPPDETFQQWATAAARTIRALAPLDTNQAIEFHRMTLPLDLLLIVRAFEMWTHEEDIERATGRPTADPDPETLTRMTDLATTLLPAGMARTGTGTKRSVRLVLTGAGGGAWDVPPGLRRVERAGPSVASGSEAGRPDTLMVVDAAAFCRVVANRTDRADVAPITGGDPDDVTALLTGAAALALD